MNIVQRNLTALKMPFDLRLLLAISVFFACAILALDAKIMTVVSTEVLWLVQVLPEVLRESVGQALVSCLPFDSA